MITAVPAIAKLNEGIQIWCGVRIAAIEPAIILPIASAAWIAKTVPALAHTSCSNIKVGVLVSTPATTDAVRGPESVLAFFDGLELLVRDVEHERVRLVLPGAQPSGLPW